MFGVKDYGVTGLGAAYLKEALAVSFDNDPIWDSCNAEVIINYIDGNEIANKRVIVQHASRKQHLLNCHLNLLTDLFDWATYRPVFDPSAQMQTILSLSEVYTCFMSDLLSEDWETFYQDIAHMAVGERVQKIENIARKIATIQRWQPATGSLKTQNPNRTIYVIPYSDLIVTVDTQHGEFEIHANQKGYDHLGAVSFDGNRYKAAVKNRGLK